jgi:Mor family transcriptional regulator
MRELKQFDEALAETAKITEDFFEKAVKNAIKYGATIEELAKKSGLTENKIKSIIDK